MSYLKLIRWPFLLLLILSQFLIKYTLFEPFGVPITLDWFGILLLSLSIACLAAGGFVINAVYNIEADRINAPDGVLIGKSISIKKANKLFFIFNIVGVGIGFYLSNIIGHPSFAILFIMASALLYAEASSLKKYILIGPIVLSLLFGLNVLVIGLFDLFPAINPETRITATTYFGILTDYFFFIVLVNFIRELVKRQMTVDSDHRLGRKSLPLTLGKDRTNKVIFILTLLPITGVAYYLAEYLYQYTLTMIYALVFLLAPLFFILIKSMLAENKKDYRVLNIVLQGILIFSILSIGLYQFVLG